MRFTSYCIAVLALFAASVCAMADRTLAQSSNTVQCPHFTASAHWKMGDGTTGNAYQLTLTNDKTSCSDATSWAKKLMKGSFSGALTVPVKGPAGYDCRITPDGYGGAIGGTCHKNAGSANATGWDWIAAS